MPSRENNPNLIEVGLYTDVKGFIQKIKKELSSAKDLGLSDVVKQEIDDIMGMVEDLGRSLTDVMGTKIDTQTFAKFEKKSSAEIKKINERVSVLEDTVHDLMVEMNSADAGKFETYIKGIRESVTTFTDATKEATDVVGSFVNNLSGTKGAVKLIDNSELSKVEIIKKNYKELLDIYENVQGSYKKVILGKSTKNDDVKQINESIDSFKKAKEAYYDYAKAGGKDPEVISRLRKELLESTTILIDVVNQVENAEKRFARNNPITADLKEEVNVIEKKFDTFASKAREILNRTNKAKPTISNEDNKTSVKVPIEVDDITKENFWPAIKRIIESAQKQADKKPIEIPFVLTSKFSSKNTNKLLKEMQQNVKNIQDDELRSNFEDLFAQLGTDVGKGVKIPVTSEIDREQRKIIKAINQIKEQLGTQLSLFPKFELDEKSIKKLQSELNKASKFLTLTIRNFELKEKGKKQLTKEVEEMSALREIVDKLNSQLDDIGQKQMPAIAKSMDGIYEMATRLEKPIHEVTSSIKELVNVLQQAFGLATQADIDTMFAGMQNSISKLSGDLRGKDNPIVSQLKDILVLYKQYQHLGGNKTLADLGGATNIQNWLQKHEFDEFATTVANFTQQIATGITVNVNKVNDAVSQVIQEAKTSAEEEVDKSANVLNALGQKLGEPITEGLLKNKSKIKKALQELVSDNIISPRDLSADNSIVSAISDEVYSELVNSKKEVEKKVASSRKKLTARAYTDEDRERWAESLSEVNADSNLARIDANSLKNLKNIQEIVVRYQQLSTIYKNLTREINSDRGSKDLKEFVQYLGTIISDLKSKMDDSKISFLDGKGYVNAKNEVVVAFSQAEESIDKTTEALNKTEQAMDKVAKKATEVRNIPSPLGKWATESISKYVKNYRSKYNEVANQIADMIGEYRSTGDLDIIKKLNEYISSSDKQLKDGSSDLYDSLKKNIQKSLSDVLEDAKKSGQQTAEQYKEGLEETKDEAKKGGQDIGKAAIEGVQEETDTHSPSKVAEKLGEYFGEGYANGILKGRNKVKNAIRALFEEGLLTKQDLKKDTVETQYSRQVLEDLGNNKKPTKAAKDLQIQIKDVNSEVENFLFLVQQTKGKAFAGIENVEQHITELTSSIKLGAIDARLALEELYDQVRNKNVKTLENELKGLGLGDKTLNLDAISKVTNIDLLKKWYPELERHNNTLWEYLNKGNGSDGLKAYAEKLGALLFDVQEKIDISDIADELLADLDKGNDKLEETSKKNIEISKSTEKTEENLNANLKVLDTSAQKADSFANALERASEASKFSSNTKESTDEYLSSLKYGSNTQKALLVSAIKEGLDKVDFSRVKTWDDFWDEFIAEAKNSYTSINQVGDSLKEIGNINFGKINIKQNFDDIKKASQKATEQNQKLHESILKVNSGINKAYKKSYGVPSLDSKQDVDDYLSSVRYRINAGKTLRGSINNKTLNGGVFPSVPYNVLISTNKNLSKDVWTDFIEETGKAYQGVNLVESSLNDVGKVDFSKAKIKTSLSDVIEKSEKAAKVNQALHESIVKAIQGLNKAYAKPYGIPNLDSKELVDDYLTSVKLRSNAENKVLNSIKDKTYNGRNFFEIKEIDYKQIWDDFRIGAGKAYKEVSLINDEVTEISKIDFSKIKGLTSSSTGIGALLSQSGDATEQVYSFVRTFKDIIKESVFHSIDKDKNPIVDFSTMIDYRKLENEIVKYDKEIITLSHQIKKSTDEEAAPLKENLAILEEQRSVYQEILNYIVKDSAYAYDESSRASFYDNRRHPEARMLTNKLKSQDIKSDNTELEKQNLLYDQVLTKITELGKLERHLQGQGISTDGIDKLLDSLLEVENGTKSLASWNEELKQFKNEITSTVPQTNKLYDFIIEKNQELLAAEKEVNRQAKLFEKNPEVYADSFREAKEAADALLVDVKGLETSAFYDSLTDEQNSNLQKLKQEFRSVLQDADAVTRNTIEAQDQMIQKLQSRIENVRKSSLTKVTNSLNQLNKITANKSFVPEVQEEVDSLRETLAKLKDIGESGQVIPKEDIDKAIASLQKLKAEVIDTNKYYAQTEKVSALYGKIAGFMDNNTAMAKEFKEQLSAIMAILKTGEPIVDSEFRNLEAHFNQISGQVKELGQTGNSFFRSFAKQLKSANAQFLATYFSFQDYIRYLRSAISTVKELDYALVDLKKTTSMSDSELRQFYFDSNDTAKALGVTTKEIIDQAAAWSRLGYSSKDAATEMAALSAQFAQISPGMSLDTATDGLVSTMKAFHVDVADVEREIMDVINKTGNTMATTNEEIVNMLERSSAAMSAANNSIKETIALESAAVQVTRNAETTGTAFRTISMRIRGYDEETEEFVGGIEELTGKVADLTKTAKNAKGISLFTDETKSTYKSTYQILKDISEIWDELTDANQAELLETLAGKRGGQVLAGILGTENFKEVERALKNMEESAGSADAEMSIVEESIQYKLNNLQQTWIGIIQKIVDNGFLGKILDALTAISEVIKDIVEATGPIPSIISGIGIMELLKNLLRSGKSLKEILDGIKTIGTVTAPASEAVYDLSSGVTSVTTAAKALSMLKMGLVIGGITAAIIIGKKVWDKYNVTVAETEENIKSIKDEISDLEKEIKELEDLDSLNSAQETRLGLLRDELGIQQQLLEVETRRKALESFTSDNDSWFKKLTDYFDEDNYDSYLDKYQNDKYLTNMNGEVFYKPQQGLEDYKEKLDDLLILQKQYSEELENAKTEEEWENASDNLAETNSKIKEIQNGVITSYGEEFTAYASLKQKLEEIRSLREELDEDDPLQDVIAKTEAKYVAQINEIRHYLIQVRKLLNKDYSDLTLDPRFDEANSHIADHSKEELNKLTEYTKNFSNEQKEAWIVATQGAKNADEAIKMYEDSLKDATNGSKELSKSTIVDSVEGINKRLKPQFDELGELYQAIFYGDDGKFSLKDVSNDQLMGIKQAFLDAEDEKGNKIGLQYEGATEAVNEFIDTLTSAETKSKSVAEQQKIAQDAVNKLATKYFYAAGGLRELNEETADAIKQQFKQMGVTNIDEIIDNYLESINNVQDAINNLSFSNLISKTENELKTQKQRLQELVTLSPTIDTTAEQEAISETEKTLEVYNNLKEKVAQGTLDVTNLTAEEIQVLKLEGSVSEETAQKLALIALQNQLISGQPITTSAQVQSLYNLGAQAGLTAAELSVLNEIMRQLDMADSVANYDTGAAEKIRSYAQSKIDSFNTLVQEKFNELSQINFAPPAVKDAAGGGGKETADAWVEAFEKELGKLDALHDQGKITTKQYLSEYRALIDKFFAGREKYAEEMAKRLHDYLSKMKDFYDSALSGVTTILDKKIDAANKGKDAATKAIEKEKEAVEERYEKEIQLIQDQMDALDEDIEKRNEVIDGLNKQIEAIDKANEARDRSIELQKAEYELQRMKNQRTALVYTGQTGQMRYERDESGVREAQENLKDKQDEILKAKLQDQIDLINKEIEAINKQKDALSKHQEELQKELETTTKYYEKMSKQTEEMWDATIKRLEDQKEKWQEIADVETIANAYSAIQQVFGDLGFTVDQVTEGNSAAFEAFKSKYVGILQEMNSGNQPFVEGLGYAADQAEKNYGIVGASAESADQIVTGLGTATEQATSNIQLLGQNASTTLLGEHGDDGTISLFNTFQKTIESVNKAAETLLGTLKKIGDTKLPTVPSVSATASKSGKSNALGNPGVTSNVESLVGELGREIVIRDGKFQTVGDKGPEFVNLKKGDIVLNNAQTEDILKKKKKLSGKSFAEGNLPDGFFRLDNDMPYADINSKLRGIGFPTLDGIKMVLKDQTDAIKADIKNVINSNNLNTTVNQSNTFNITGVSGEDVARQINTTLVNTFSGMSLNAYQRSKA